MQVSGRAGTGIQRQFRTLLVTFVLTPSSPWERGLGGRGVYVVSMYMFRTTHSSLPKHSWGRQAVEICGSINIPPRFLPLHLFMNSELLGSRETAWKKAIRAQLEPLLLSALSGRGGASTRAWGWPWEFPAAPTPAAACSASAHSVELSLPRVVGTVHLPPTSRPPSAGTKDLIPRGIQALDGVRKEGFPSHTKWE